MLQAKTIGNSPMRKNLIEVLVKELEEKLHAFLRLTKSRYQVSHHIRNPISETKTVNALGWKVVDVSYVASLCMRLDVNKCFIVSIDL